MGGTVGSNRRPGPPASLMRRCAAVAIDLPIAVVVVLGPLLVADRILQFLAVPDSRAGTIWLTAAAVWLLLFVLGYSPLCLSRWGGTLGKHVMGVEVARASDGARLNYGPAVLRHVINVVVTTVPVFLVAHVSSINLSANHQGMHDKAVGSVVVHRR
ncbi:RDD family protein [Streptomyces sp900116325]|uniref:RDD family protein n=1 Tax=Streptomyces sp. 900116325 TaxID=3154295 RepID=UPI0033B979EC